MKIAKETMTITASGTEEEITEIADFIDEGVKSTIFNDTVTFRIQADMITVNAWDTEDYHTVRGWITF